MSAISALAAHPACGRATLSKGRSRSAIQEPAKNRDWRCLLLLMRLLVRCLCAYLPHARPVRAALMNRFYSHGTDSKKQKSGKTRAAGSASRSSEHRITQARSTRTEAVQAAVVRQDHE